MPQTDRPLSRGRGPDPAPRARDSSHRSQSQEGTNPRRPGTTRVNQRSLSLELRGRGELVSSNLLPIQADSDALPVAVLTYDLDGTVTSANQAAATLLGSNSLASRREASSPTSPRRTASSAGSRRTPCRARTQPAMSS